MESPPEFLKSLYAWSELFRRLTMRDFMLFAKKAGLSMSQLGVLIHLHHGGPCAVSDIAVHGDVTNAAASQMIDRLVQQGWMVRSEDPIDRRSKQVALTQKGKKLVEESLNSGNKWMSALSDSLSVEQQAEIVKALILLIQAAQNIEGSNSVNCFPDKE
jgi:DNA-binding MarR family transcriptional regulator